MIKSRKQYVDAMVIDATNNPSMYLYSDISEIVENELKTYKAIYFRLEGHKPSWFSMDDIDDIISEIQEKIKLAKQKAAYYMEDCN